MKVRCGAQRKSENTNRRAHKGVRYSVLIVRDKLCSKIASRISCVFCVGLNIYKLKTCVTQFPCITALLRNTAIVSVLINVMDCERSFKTKT